MSRRDVEHARREAGFATPVFAGIVLGLGVILVSVMLLARQDLRLARRDADAFDRQVLFEGLAAKASLSILAANGEPTLVWREPTDQGLVAVQVEPEARKIDPLTADPSSLAPHVARLVAEERLAETMTRLASLSKAGQGRVGRADIAGLAPDPAWRACSATLLSPYSRYSALRLLPPRSPSGHDKAGQHLGEVWRISVLGERGAFLEQIVRVTGRRPRPVEVLEQEVGRDTALVRSTCLNRLGIEEAADAI